MVQLRAIIELEAIADTDPPAWRVPERQLVVHQMLDGDRAIEGGEWSWERPRINWRGGAPPTRPRVMVELQSGEVKQEQRLKWPNLVGLAALIGALGGVGVQCRQARGLDDQIATLQQDKADLTAAADRREAEHEARIDALAQRIQARDLCGFRAVGLEDRVDDCLLALQRSIEKAAEGALIYDELDRLP
jgi:hypothetical protein